MGQRKKCRVPRQTLQTATCTEAVNTSRRAIYTSQEQATAGHGSKVRRKSCDCQQIRQHARKSSRVGRRDFRPMDALRVPASKFDVRFLAGRTNTTSRKTMMFKFPQIKSIDTTCQNAGPFFPFRSKLTHIKIHHKNPGLRDQIQNFRQCPKQTCVGVFD